MKVEIAYALPEQQTVIELELADGATVLDALAVIGNQAPFSELPLQEMPVGIYGERVERDHGLREGDRLELYRPLRIDPREARRRRAREP